MTDEQLDRAVRDADPYRPEHARSLHGADQILLEEIMSVPTIAGRRPARRWAAAVAAAAAVTGVLAVTPLIGRDHRAPVAVRPNPPAGRPVAAAAVADRSPRLLIGEAGWKADAAYGFAEHAGTMRFAKGPLKLEINWYSGEHYDSYYQDRLHVSEPTPATIDGWPGSLFRYSATRFAVMLRPRDGAFVELGTASEGWTRAEFDRVAALIHRVDVATWLAAMPPEVVTPARVQQAAAEVLADIPLPPGFSAASLDDLGTNDRYQFGAQVTGRVGCAWIAEWVRADQAGDQAAVEKAATALRGSHRWKVLEDMADDGGWSEVFWEVADKTVRSGPPDGYEDAIGCR
ncbi:hypothetical protein [Actinoplanes sp. M2I2]|uniref:hypothetical protein n=1 Tax=Actinoplanes sp. M2I2 TaxID=1734444 RepID=UPI0020208FB3|nr:hypothetical protein [Actinoplanes sp. M2I2]